MKIEILASKQDLGRRAAALGGAAIREAIAARRAARIVVATGASQFEMLDALVADAGIDWSKVTGFHLDEYIGMPDTHPASFRRYLRERFTSRLPKLGVFHFIIGDAPDLDGEIARVNDLVKQAPIDVCFAGIGENAHLAFNDPPADFETKAPFMRVALDDACRRQQFGEGWFPTFDDVPKEAISMSIAEIMAAKKLILTVPDARKAAAVKGALEGPVTPDCPASIIQRHPDCWLGLDPESAKELKNKH